MLARLTAVLLLLSAFPCLGQKISDSLVHHQIVYKTSKASEVYLVWTMNSWTLPAPNCRPPGTYIKNGMAYTKMKGAKDSFNIDLLLPPGTYMDFMIWAAKNPKGDSIEGWDNNWNLNYNIYIDDKNPITSLNDEKLYITEKKQAQKPSFNLLTKGSTVLFTGFAFVLMAFVLLIVMKQKRQKINWLSGTYFLAVYSLPHWLLC